MLAKKSNDILISDVTWMLPVTHKRNISYKSTPYNFPYKNKISKVFRCNKKVKRKMNGNKTKKLDWRSFWEKKICLIKDKKRNIMKAIHVKGYQNLKNHISGNTAKFEIYRRFLIIMLIITLCGLVDTLDINQEGKR